MKSSMHKLYSESESRRNGFYNKSWTSVETRTNALDAGLIVLLSAFRPADRASSQRLSDPTAFSGTQMIGINLNVVE